MDTDVQHGEALHLVQVVEDMNESGAEMTEGFVVNEDAARRIASLEGKIAVLGIAGAYRSGKSFLVNKMIGRAKSFVVGHSIRSCTRGIWCYSVPLPCVFEDGEKGHVLILDTEGLGSTDRSSHYDDQVFSLATLISSKLIYNSVGTIDEKSIQKLSFVGNLCKILGENTKVAEKEGKTTDDLVPKFVWVLRDFSLKLVDEDGEAISSNEYMENNLESKKGYDKRTMQRNRVCDMLRSFFRDRECHTLITPAADEDVLQNIEDQQKSLRPEFLQQVDDFRTTVLASLKPKSVSGCPVNGAGFVSLVKTYVAAINGGAVPNLADAWTSAVQTQCAQAKDEVVKKCLAASRDFRKKFPLEEADLRDSFRELVDEGLALYDKKAPVGSQITKDLRKELTQELIKIEAELLERNAEKSATACETLAQELFQKYISGPLTIKEQKLQEQEDKEEDSDNEESEEEEPVDLAELFEVIWDGYRQMRTKYFKKAVGPSKVEVIERTMQKLEPQTQRAISFGERRLDVINAELKAAESAAEGMVAQLKSLRDELDGERERRAELSHKNVQLSEAISVTQAALEETKDALLQKTLQCDEKEAQLKESIHKVSELEEKLVRSNAQVELLEQKIGILEATIDGHIETIRIEKKRRGDVVSGLQRGVSMAQAIRSQQTALVAAIREQSRVNTDEVQTLEYKLYQFLQGQLSGKKEQVEGMLERQRNLAQQLEQITQQKRDLQQRYEEARSKANRAEAMTAHDEGEVSQLHAKLQDEITNKERLKSSLRAMQKKYEKEKKLRQKMVNEEADRKVDPGNPFGGDANEDADNPFGDDVINSDLEDFEGAGADNPFGDEGVINSDLEEFEGGAAANNPFGDDNGAGGGNNPFSDEDDGEGAGGAAKSHSRGRGAEGGPVTHGCVWGDEAYEDLTRQQLVAEAKRLQSQLDFEMSLAMMMRGMMVTKINFGSNRCAAKWISLSMDRQTIRWAKNPDKPDKATEVAVADLLWVHWGHRTKVQMRNILQNDRKTRGKKAEERDPWLLFSLQSSERTFDFYCHDRSGWNQVMGWVHGLGRLIMMFNPPVPARAAGRRKQDDWQHRPASYLAQTRHYRARMMWRKLMEKMDL